MKVQALDNTSLTKEKDPIIKKSISLKQRASNPQGFVMLGNLERASFFLLPFLTSGSVELLNIFM